MLIVDELDVFFEFENRKIHVLDSISFNIQPKTFVGLVGESGSGKSVTALSILNLLGPTANRSVNTIFWNNRDISAYSEKEMITLRGREIGLIFQNPLASLNPVFTIEQQFVETICLHKRCSREEARLVAIQALKDVSIADPERRLSHYPHQFSLGMCQRIMIALTLVMEPKLIIADEPTASLDVTVQAQIMDLIQLKRQQHGMSVLFISHDLGVVAQHCDVIMVMYLGQIVEIGTAVEIFKSPKHPYTQALISSIPVPDPTIKQSKIDLKGEIPSPIQRPSGCPFHPRCNFAVDMCRSVSPKLVKQSESHHVACPVLN